MQARKHCQGSLVAPVWLEPHAGVGTRAGTKPVPNAVRRRTHARTRMPSARRLASKARSYSMTFATSSRAFAVDLADEVERAVDRERHAAAGDDALVFDDEARLRQGPSHKPGSAKAVSSVSAPTAERRVVARRPSSVPAAARMSAPVQTDAISSADAFLENQASRDCAPVAPARAPHTMNTSHGGAS